MGSVQRNRRRERSRHVGDGAILGRSAPPPVLRCIARPMERSPRAARRPSPRRGEVRRGLPGPSAPLSKVEEEASEEGGPEAEASGHPGCRIATVVHRSGPCEERRERQQSQGQRCSGVKGTHLPCSSPSHPTPKLTQGVVFPLGGGVDLSIIWRALSVLRRR